MCDFCPFWQHKNMLNVIIELVNEPAKYIFDWASNCLFTTLASCCTHQMRAISSYLVMIPFPSTRTFIK